jgi:hypothetical protein
MFNGSACKSGGPEALRLCHGPHMYTERLIGPAGGDPTTFPAWRRPFRRARIAPPDLALVAGPVSLPAAALAAGAFPGLDRSGLGPAEPAALAWLEGGVTVYRTPALATPRGDRQAGLWGVPAHRLAGLYAPANAEFTTHAFEMPAAGLYLNADAAWPGVAAGAAELYCDERCQAYVMVAVVEPGPAGRALPGFEAERCVLTNINGLRIPLRWARGDGGGGGGGALVAPVPAGRVMALRIYYRAATVFSVGALAG